MIGCILHVFQASGAGMVPIVVENENGTFMQFSDDDRGIWITTAATSS